MFLLLPFSHLCECVQIKLFVIVTKQTFFILDMIPKFQRQQLKA